MNVDKEKLFRYYKFILELDNILSIKVDKCIFADSFRYRFVDDIKQHFYDQKIKKAKFSLGNKIINTIAMPIVKLDEFFDSMSFLEKTINYAQKNYYKYLTQDDTLEDSVHFTFAPNNAYQYGIVFNFAKEKPYQSGSRMMPFVVLPLPSECGDGSSINPLEIYGYTKKILGLEYDQEIDEKGLLSSYPVLNPLLLEPYNLDYKVFESTAYENIVNDVNSYFQESKLNEIDEGLIFKGIYLVAFSQNYTRGLMKIYDTILKDGLKINTLLDDFFSVHLRKLGQAHSTPIDKKEIYTTDRIFRTYFNHLGAYDFQNSLADTQRLAMSCYIDGESKIIPVNGAPGTGKTSLLRAIIGDYIVKSALKSYDAYVAKQKIEFPTPIVCSSTNNQALFNIYEGVDKAFAEHIEKMNGDILYTRWLNYQDDFFNKTSSDEDPSVEDDGGGDVEIKDEPENLDYKTNFFIPSIKGKRGKFYEMSKDDMLSVLSSLSNQFDFFEKCFVEYIGDLSFFTDDEKQFERLKKIANYFYGKLQESLNEITKEKSQVQRVDKLSILESELVKKYVNDEHTDRLVKHSFKTYKVQKEKINNLLTELTTADTTIEELKNVRNENNKHLLKLKSDLSNNAKSPEDIRKVIEKIESEIVNLGNQIEDPSSSHRYKNEYDAIAALVLQRKKEFLSKELITMQSDIIDKSGGLTKFLFNMFNLGGGIKKRLIDIKVMYDEKISNIAESKEYLDEVVARTNEKIVQSLQSGVEELEKKLSIEIENENKLVMEESNIKDKKSLLEVAISGMDKKIDDEKIKIEECRQKLKKYNLVFDENELLQLYEASMCGDDVEEIEKRYKEYDKSIRTQNFYYAMHLLETLFFINCYKNPDKENALLCPYCKDGDMIEQTNDQSTINCKDCEASLHSSQLTKNNLTKKDGEELIKKGIIFVGKKIYTLEVNKTEKKVFLNIKDGASGNSDIFYKTIFPIFPVVNITCNSFGTVTQYKNESGESKTLEDFFDFLLIDEAGTIPASKMVIINAAKKVMLFGDVLQLKPVLPFDFNVEKEMLKMFFDKDDEISNVGEYFSCASKPKEITKPISNNAMAIANNASMIFLPYNDSKLEGDIWLKEHFRCKDEIIAISNEISYQNEIIQCSGVGGRLRFIESGGEKIDNINNEEARLIIKYLQDNIENLCRFLNCEQEELGRKIGIITPFAKQEYKITQLLTENRLGSIKVGTVHKFQGSEREVIIFSTVYGPNSGDPKNFFFNREDPDMINVAVTRAKKMFVCFGNEKLLSKGETYSAKMMKHIMSVGAR